MADNRKAIIISTGMDNIQLLAALKDSEVATGASLERIKGLYVKYSEQQAALESAKNDASLAKLKANDDLKLAEMERFFAAQRAMYEEQAAVAALASNASYATSPAGDIVRTGATVAKDAKAAELEIGTFRKAGRELKELGRIIGEFTGLSGVVVVLRRIAGSLKAIGLLGSLAVVAVGIGAALGTGINKLFGGEIGKLTGLGDGGKGEASDWWSWWTARKNADESQKDLERLQKFAAGRHAKQERVSDNRINALRDFQEQAANINRVEATTPQAKYIEDTMRLMQLQAQLNQLNPDSPQWLEVRKEWNTVYLKQLQDIHDEQDQTAKDKKKEQEDEANRQKEIKSLKDQQSRLQVSMDTYDQRQNMQFPSLAQIAKNGWQWHPRDGWQRTDVGQMAHDVLFDEKDQVRQRLLGNFDIANQEASQEGYLKRTLGDMGLLPKEEKWDEMANHMQTLTKQIANVTAGKSLAVTIEDVADTK